jgi:hypothetical protein
VRFFCGFLSVHFCFRVCVCVSGGLLRLLLHNLPQPKPQPLTPTTIS